MPWPERTTMDAKVQFVAAVLEDEASMTELCEQFGVSRTAGYQLLKRYREEGEAAFKPRSRAPHRIPWAVTVAQREAIVGLRAAHPYWGPKKLRAKLCAQASQQQWPALSTIGDLLKRAGLVRARARRRSAVVSPHQLVPALKPNAVWGIDFKGWWRSQDGMRCDPLTVTDTYSRFLLCAQLVERCDYECSRRALERVFREYGLPEVMRSDNGSPFASVGAGGLSHLAVWWVKLGILPERIAPAQPQQNGRHERMHRTLKAECAAPPASTRAAQQARLDEFRAEFNHQRPHEALGQTPPVQHYQPSPRPYPARLEDPVYPDDCELRRVRHNGQLRWEGELVFLSEALCGEVVGLCENQDGDQEVYFGPLHLGTIDVVALTLRRPAQVSTVRRGGKPSSRSSQKLQKV